MSNITADEVIKLALGSNQGLINRREDQTRQLINQGLSRRSGIPTGPGIAAEDDHGDTGPAGDNPYGLEPELWRRIQRLNEMSPFGPNTVSIKSGYRSYEEQEELYQRYLRGEGNLAAPPGRSNHNHGEAADLGYMSDEAREWVHSVAADLGLHFPVRGENWHVERIR